MISRRAFLGSAAAGLASPVLATDEPAKDAIEAIDCHTHFYDPRRPQGVPWPGKGDKLLYRPVLPEEFRQLTRQFNVRGTVVVEASPWLEDNQWLLDLARKDRFVVGVVGNLDPFDDAFAKHLARFAQDPVFRGIRVNHGDLRRGLERLAYVANLGRLAESDRELDVNGGPDMPADVARLAQRLPGLRIVINHAANLRIDGKAVPEAWRKGMAAAADNKQVFCKVSALVEGTGSRKGDAPADVAYYRPVLDALWQIWGPDRLLFGSNWPVSDNAAPFARLYEIVRAYFAGHGRAASEKFFAKNAAIAYKPRA